MAPAAAAAAARQAKRACAGGGLSPHVHRHTAAAFAWLARRIARRPGLAVLLPLALVLLLSVG